MVLCDAYTEQLEEGEQHVILKLKPELAPIKAGIFPLLKKDGLPELAEKLYHDLKRHFKVQYDEAGSIGKRYYRQDEIGTPFCFTIDHETLNDQTVTVRYRDTGYQERINLSQAKAFLTEKLS
jgi:glycyl-tRNA synthetase